MEDTGISVETVIALGSNHGDRRSNITSAAEYLASELNGFRCSEIYETPALNGIDSPYLNAVARGATRLSYETLNELMKNWETAHGRTSEARLRHEVTIDLDIVIYNGTVMRPADAARDYFTRGYRMVCAPDRQSG